MEQLTNNEIKALQHLADGKQHNDTPKGLTDAQYYTALKSLKEKDMVFAAFICGGIAEAAEIKMKGKAYLDDLASQNNDDFEYDEEIDGDIYEVLEFLSDGEEHFDTPDLDNYDEVCEELEDLGYVDMGFSKDDGIKLTRKGKKLWKAIIENEANHLCPLEFEILNTIRFHEKEIASTEKGTKNIYDYLTLYTKAEITKCSLKMEKKGWIKCFHDDGPAYYHTLLDNGRIVLRNYIEQTDSIPNKVTEATGIAINEGLVKALSEFFYEKEDIIPYITEIQRENNDMETVKITASYLKDRKIHDYNKQYCSPLHNVLHNYDLYHAKISNWDKQIKIHYTDTIKP